ncbi:MAG: RHS repeat-associated core domain-containing protein, partial [bacterium]
TYTTDADRRRTLVGGTWARVTLPPALTTTIYNANNQQTKFGTKTLTYDLNGNLTNDGNGNITYTWDARDRLTATSASNSTFQYDPLGRRTKKVTSGTTRRFHYDGINPVQELDNAGNILANVLTGLGIDEFFTRSGSPGTRTLLGDALNSTLALADDTGTVQTTYTYEPFGTSSVTGQSNTNSYQYTGRENDGTGLDYYRARYYYPARQRFISEDPIELAASDINLYAYVANDPLGYVDPLGLDAFVTIYHSTKQPFGHVGLGVNTSATVGFYPIESAPERDILRRRPVPGRVVSDKMSHLIPIETFRIPTSLEQDACITKFIGLRTADPGDYILGGRSCGEFVRDALQSCGVKGVEPGGFVAPFGVADRLRLHYKRAP